MGGSELPRLLDITGAHQCQAVACCLPQQLPPQEGAASAAAVLGWGVRAPLGPFPCGCKALENLSESLHRDPSPVQGFASRCGHGTCGDRCSQTALTAGSHGTAWPRREMVP